MERLLPGLHVYPAREDESVTTGYFSRGVSFLDEVRLATALGEKSKTKESVLPPIDASWSRWNDGCPQVGVGGTHSLDEAVGSCRFCGAICTDDVEDEPRVTTESGRS